MSLLTLSRAWSLQLKHIISSFPCLIPISWLSWRKLLQLAWSFESNMMISKLDPMIFQIFPSLMILFFIRAPSGLTSKIHSSRRFYMSTTLPLSVATSVSRKLYIISVQISNGPACLRTSSHSFAVVQLVNKLSMLRVKVLGYSNLYQCPLEFGKTFPWTSSPIFLTPTGSQLS